MGFGMEWDGIDRRSGDCPCKYVIELSAVVQGEFKLLRQEIQHTSNEMQELNLRTKECVDNLTRGAKALEDGDRRFESIEKCLDEHKHGKRGEHAVINKRMTVIASVLGACVATLVVMGGGDKLVNFIVRII